MAAFSYHEQPNSFLLDSVLIPNKNMNSSGNFLEEGNYNFINSSTCFPQFYTSTPLDHQYYHPLLVETPHPHVIGFHETQFDDHSSKAATFSDNETSVSAKQISPESSTVVDSNNNNNNNNKLEGGGDEQQVTQKPNSGKKRRNSTNLNSAQSKDVKEEKPKKQKKCNNDGKKKEEEKKPKTDDEKKVADQETTGYIHVRARRGQATDSHSLAERVRREKISERMKMLQRLVPGCDKVTGKALMLDEIINYVQSLQNQVEFLSMKLASVNPLFYDFGMDLGALMVRPESLSSSMASPLPSLQQCSPIQTTAFADATTTTTTTTTAAATTTTNYPVTDASTTPLFLQGQLFQDGGSSCLMWDADEQRQKLLIPSGFAHNLCSFH